MSSRQFDALGADSGPETGSALVPCHYGADILPQYKGTPVETLLRHHNLGEHREPPPEPRAVVVTCMDHRVALRMPDGFAMVLRTAGATVEPLMFNVACALAIRNVRTVCVIGHSDCAMVDIGRHRGCVVETVTRLGPMTRDEADEFFERGAQSFGLADAVAHTAQESANLRRHFPEILVSPLFLDVEDGMLRQIA